MTEPQQEKFSPQKIELCRRAFTKMPSFDPVSRTIDCKEIPALLKAMKYEREVPAEVAQSYVDFHAPDTVHAQRLKFENFLQYCKYISDSVNFARALLGSFDMDGDGFIEADEFNRSMACLKVHDPKFPQVSYEQFKEEADTNKDGKVSVDEAIAWLELHAPKEA